MVVLDNTSGHLESGHGRIIQDTGHSIVHVTQLVIYNLLEKTISVSLAMSIEIVH